MLSQNSRFPAILALVGAVIGLVFATYSTLDYAQHLDRKLHDVHCSFIPGAPATSEAEACRAAMYSPYSALFREDYWGGVPISLFALGAFTFFAGFALYLAIAGERAPRRSVGFFALVSITPLLVSLLMFGISLTKIGSLCKTCVGIYVSSFLVASGGLLGLATLQPEGAEGADGRIVPRRPVVSALIPVFWLAALGVTTFLPALVYASTVPDQRAYLTKCGELKRKPALNDSLITMRGPRARQSAILFEDPLCPTCKAFHQRVIGEDVIDKLDALIALFPLDNECNWMVDSALHPGACVVSRLLLCSGDRAREVLDWSYEEQEDLARAGKAGVEQLRALIERRWGAAVLPCLDARETKIRLNNHLHFASDNAIPVSTPQMYLGTRRICEEDTDIGLRYTLGQLAPEVLK